MQKFGEIYIATYKDNTHWAKWAHHGTPSIWVGYAENHPAGTYRIFNPKTRKIILTQDMTFLQKSYGEVTQVDKPVVDTTSYEGSNEDGELETVSVVNNKSNVNVVTNTISHESEENLENENDNFFDEDINNQVEINPKTTVNAKVVQAMKKLQTLYNDNANKIVEQAAIKIF